MKVKRYGRRVLAAILAAILAVPSGVTALYTEVQANDTLPFTVRDNIYGVMDSQVTSKKITLVDGASVLKNPEGEGFCFVINGDRSYLVGAKGYVTDFSGTDPEGSYLCGSESTLGDFSENPALYAIKDPGTGKYGIYNATDGVWHDYQLDEIPVVRDVDDLSGEEERIWVEKDGLYGLLNMSGEMLYSPKYSSIRTIVGSCALKAERENDNGTEYTLLSLNGSYKGELSAEVASRGTLGIITVEYENGYKKTVINLETGEKLGTYPYEFEGTQTKITLYDSVTNGTYAVITTEQDGHSRATLLREDGTSWSWGDSVESAFDTSTSTVFYDNPCFDDAVIVRSYVNGGKYNYTLVDLDGMVLRDLYTWRDENGNGLHQELEDICRHALGYTLWKNNEKYSRFQASGEYFLTDENDNVVVDNLDYGYLEAVGDFLILRDSSGYEIYDTRQKKMLVYDIGNGIRKMASDQLAEINNENYLYGYLNLQTGAFSGYHYRVEQSATWSSAKMLEDGRAAIVVRNFLDDEHSNSEICCLNESMKNWKLDDAWDGAGAFVNDDLTVTISTQPECSSDEGFYDDERDCSGRMGVFDTSGQKLASYTYEWSAAWWRGLKAFQTEGQDSTNLSVVNRRGGLLVDGDFQAGEEHAWGHRFAYAGRDGVSILQDVEDDRILYIYDMTQAENVEGSGQQPEPSKTITEDELFGAYSKYLQNAAYNKITQTLHGDMAAVNADRSGLDNSLAILKSNMKNGAVASVINAIISSISGEYYNQDELERSAAVELIGALSSDRDVLGDVVNDLLDEINGKMKMPGTVMKIIQNGYSSAKEKGLLAEALADDTFTEAEILKSMEILEENWKGIKDQWSDLDDAVTNAQVIWLVYMTARSNKTLVKNLMELIDSDTCLYGGLKHIENYQKHMIPSMIVQLVKKKVFKELCKTLTKEGIGSLAGDMISSTGGVVPSGAIAVAEMGYEMLSSVLPYPSSDAVVLSIISVSNQNVLSSALSDEYEKITMNYQNNGGIEISELKKEYSLLYHAYLASLTCGYEKVMAVAKENSYKDALQTHYSVYESKLTYQKYLKSCLANANAHWTIAVEKGEAAIQTCRLGSSGSAVRAANAEGITLNIPEIIDGVTVTEIGDGALANLDNLECIYVPDTVTTVGEEAFSGCSSLKTIFLGGNVQDIAVNAFEDIPSVTICAPENDALKELADSSANITLEIREPEVVSLKILNEPQKLTYTMSELAAPENLEGQIFGAVDTEGLVLEATLEDGSSREITQGFSCGLETKQIGRCTVIVDYEGVIASYSITVTADMCDYRVSYKDLEGTTLAEDVTGNRMAGTFLELPIKEISGYIPICEFREEKIGADNHFTVYYAPYLKLSIADASCVIAPDMVYDGKAKEPAVTLTLAGAVLVEGKDYTVTYTNNVNVGTGSVIIAGTGDYTGSFQRGFIIAPRPLQGAKAKLSYSAVTYTGKAANPGVQVNILDKMLNRGTDYIVTYQNNIAVGSSSVRITGRGNYTGIIVLTFTINPVKTKLSKVSGGKKSITVKWKKKTKEVGGYQIRYSLKSSMKGAKTKTISGYKKNSCKLTKLKSKKKYFIQIRTYKSVKGKKYYSGWSTKKSGKAK